MWWLRIPEGKVYGPVHADQLDQWVGEGRVGRDCWLSSDDWGHWEPAERIYPALIPQAGPPVRRGSPFRLVGDGSIGRGPTGMGQLPGSPSAPEQDLAHQTPRERYVAPHRAGVILALGLLSWLTCPFLGFLAWSLGSGDLRAMAEGQMDPEGATLTRAGYILGMVQAMLAIFVTLAGLFMIIARLA